MSKSPLGEDKRRHFRLRYPAGNKPRLIIDGKEYEIIDLAEGGVKFTCPGVPRIASDGKIKGTVEFRNGESFELEGQVLRSEIVIVLNKGVSNKRIVKEQVRVRCHQVDMKD